MPIPKAITRFNRTYLNKVLIRLAGQGSFVDLEHVGRKSGRVMHTVLMAFRPPKARDTVTIALTYGPDVDWLKNIRKAGRCRMRMGNSLLHLGAPNPIPVDVGISRMPQPQRTLLRGPINIEHFIELPVLAEEPWDGERSGTAWKYAVMYRLGLTPWEGYARVARASIGAQLDRAAARRTPPGRTLDIGCGRGVHSASLAERGWDVVGIDQQEKAIEAARERGIRGARFELADATRLESANLGAFDFFLDIGCFQGLDAPARSAYGRGVTALANPGASLLLMAFGPTRMRWLTEGVTGNEVTDALPHWRLVHSEPAETKGLGWPMNRSRPRWFQFELDDKVS